MLSKKLRFCYRPDSTSLYCYPVLTMILFILTLMDTFVVIQICWQSSIWWVVLVPKWDSQKKEVPPPLKCCRVRSHTITKVSLRARVRVGVKNVIFDQRVFCKVVNATHSCRRDFKRIKNGIWPISSKYVVIVSTLLWINITQIPNMWGVRDIFWICYVHTTQVIYFSLWITIYIFPWNLKSS